MVVLRAEDPEDAQYLQCLDLSESLALAQQTSDGLGVGAILFHDHI